jgi:hypothetical protein
VLAYLALCDLTGFRHLRTTPRWNRRFAEEVFEIFPENLRIRIVVAFCGVTGLQQRIPGAMQAVLWLQFSLPRTTGAISRAGQSAVEMANNRYF